MADQTETTDQTVDAFLDGMVAHNPAACDGNLSPADIRAGLAAAAPHIAAQALRDTAAILLDEDRAEPFGHDDRCGYGPPGTCDCERGEAYRWLTRLASGLAPCPTCTGPIRETVGMVCQACGADYAADGHSSPATPTRTKPLAECRDCPPGCAECTYNPILRAMCRCYGASRHTEENHA